MPNKSIDRDFRYATLHKSPSCSAFCIKRSQMLINRHIKIYGLAIVVVGIASIIGIAQRSSKCDLYSENGMSDDEYHLEDMSRGQFQEAKYPKMDALISVIAPGKEPSAKVKQTVDDAGEGRWHPFEGGWKVTCPYFNQNYDRDLFTIEKDGWDHGHCDACNATIDAGGSCWVNHPDNDFIICGDCYQKLQ